MTPLIVTPPAIEPVSLDEAKDFLRLLAEDEDALLATLITAARLMIEAASGRMLIEQGWRIVLDRWPEGGVIRVPVSPVRAISAARILGPDDTALPLADEALALVEGSDPPLIEMVGPLQAPGKPRAGIEIDILAGFGPTRDMVPAPLRQAVLRLAARWFEHRGDVVSHDAERLPAEIAALVAPYRRARL